MDETGTSRRAVFEAVVSAGGWPCAFEFMAASRPKNPTLPREAGDDESADEHPVKARIDRLIDSADYFIGIYAETIGHRESHLDGMRPIEYEFERFLLSSRLRFRDEADANKQKAELDRHFPPAWATKEARDEARVARRMLREQIREQLACLPHNSAEDDPATDLSDLVDGKPYARLFVERVLLFLRRRQGDGAISTELMRALRNKPYTEYRSCVDDASDTSKELPAYLSAPAALYTYARKWLSQRQVKPRPRETAEFTLLFQALNASAEDVCAVAECIYSANYNQTGVKIHSELNCCTIAASFSVTGLRKSEVRIGEVRQEIRRCMREALRHRPEVLRRHLKHDVFSGLRRFDEVSTKASELRRKHGAGYYRHHSLSPTGNTREFAVTVSTADVPGMFYKSLERIVAHKGILVDCHMHPSLRRPFSIRIDVDYVQGREDQPSDSPQHLKITYDPYGAEYPMHFIVLWQVGFAESKWSALQAQLRFLMGVHDVRLGTAVFDDRKPKRPRVKPGELDA